MSSDDLVVTLEYRSLARSAVQNWKGPGWYVMASTSDNHGTFAVEPRRISPAVAQEIAAAFGVPVANLARAQQSRGRAQLADRVARLEAVAAELASASDDLAAFDAMTGVVPVGDRGQQT